MSIEPDLTLGQVAEILRLSKDTVEDMGLRGIGPPRYRASPKRWRYPAPLFRAWQKKRLEAAQTDKADTAA